MRSGLEGFWLGLGCAVLALVAGCGQMLDFDPPDPTGEDGGMDAAPFEAGTTDAARNDSGRVDGDIQDASGSDAEEFEPDASEEGGTGESDAGEPDSGATDAGRIDAGEPDSGATDAGRIDAGESDAGIDSGRSGCVTDRDCDDGNPCTRDTCEPGLGCTFMPLSDMACDDGNACTVSDTCRDGWCIGTPRTCDDRNPCTRDACVPGVGCTFTPLSDMACDDGNVCTDRDTCIMGTCTGTPRTCDDRNPCTRDACVPGVGCTLTPLSGGACDDGNVCTDRDTCMSGMCVGITISCPDRTCYMVTGCDPMLGCRYDTAPPRTPCTTAGGGRGTCDGRGNCLSLGSDG